MEQLTIEQKITAYEHILVNITHPDMPNRLTPFVCVQMQIWIKDNMNSLYIVGMNALQYFPEFIKHKPSNRSDSGVWWADGDHYLRIQAVKDTIAELKAQANTNHINEIYKHTPFS